MKRLLVSGLASVFLLLLAGITACETVRNTKSEILRSAQVNPALNECQRTVNMPQKMRMANYRAPTPDCVPHGITVDSLELQQLLQQSSKPVLIDVLSVISRPNTDFGETQWIPNKERLSLPGSAWLPNVGYGKLDAEMRHYFKSQLHRLTDGDRNRPLVIFCIADCWMSWNAVQRAYDYGYTNLYWFKNGTDGWLEQGFTLQKIEPIPLAVSE